nr:hypothetical protein [uncultured Rhodoferax sp.]
MRTNSLLSAVRKATALLPQLSGDLFLAMCEGETQMDCLKRHGFTPQNFNPTRRTFEQRGRVYRVLFWINEFPQEAEQ